MLKSQGTGSGGTASQQATTWEVTQLSSKERRRLVFVKLQCVGDKPHVIQESSLATSARSSPPEDGDIEVWLVKDLSKISRHWVWPRSEDPKAPLSSLLWTSVCVCSSSPPRDRLFQQRTAQPFVNFAHFSPLESLQPRDFTWQNCPAPEMMLPHVFRGCDVPHSLKPRFLTGLESCSRHDDLLRYYFVFCSPCFPFLIPGWWPDLWTLCPHGSLMI